MIHYVLFLDEANELIIQKLAPVIMFCLSLSRYREVDENHHVIQWLWQALEQFTDEERVLFMRFVSGRSRLPASVADISQRFQIMRVDKVSRMI